MRTVNITVDNEQCINFCIKSVKLISYGFYNMCEYEADYVNSKTQEVNTIKFRIKEDAIWLDLFIKMLEEVEKEENTNA